MLYKLAVLSLVSAVAADCGVYVDFGSSGPKVCHAHALRRSTGPGTPFA